MENLSANQTAVNNTNIVNRYISCKTPQCFKPVNDTVYKNHNYSRNKFSYEHCNIKIHDTSSKYTRNLQQN
jgi:hypothetical protein